MAGSNFGRAVAADAVRFSDDSDYGFVFYQSFGGQSRQSYPNGDGLFSGNYRNIYARRNVAASHRKDQSEFVEFIGFVEF